jgi:hypothetical protein
MHILRIPLILRLKISKIECKDTYFGTKSLHILLFFFECPATLGLFTHSAEVDNRANRRLLELFKRQGLWNNS